MVDCIASGCYKYLMTGNGGGQFTTITSLLGTITSTNPVNNGQPMLFTNDLLTDIANTSAIAAVMSDHGGWQAPQRLGTERFRRLRLDLFADPARDSQFNVIETSSITEDRLHNVFRAFQALLHRRDNDAIVWGDIMTTGCMLLAEPDPMQMTAASGNQMSTMVATAYYGVSFSGYTDALSL